MATMTEGTYEICRTLTLPVARAERSCRSDGSNPPRMRR